MKKYINTSNYYLSTTTSRIESDTTNGTFDVSDVTVDGVTLPLKGYYWVDVDFGDVSKREIFRIKERNGYTLHYDARISPNGATAHNSGASVGLRDFSQLLNSLSTNTDDFGEIEQTDNLTIKAHGGIVYVSGKANADSGKRTVDTKQFILNANSVTYIVLDIDEVQGALTGKFEFQAVDASLLKDEGQYPIAKITTGASMINLNDGIEDLRAVVVGGGDMRSAVYDPEGKRKELYLMDNMEQSEDGMHLFVTQAQIDLWNSYQESKQAKLISGENIVTISGKSIIDPSVWPNGNVSLDTVLTCGWETHTTGQAPETFTFPSDKLPLTEKSFLVFSGTDGVVLTCGEGENDDYTYNNETHTITFIHIASNEYAVIWWMYNNSSSSVGIGDGHITIKWGDGEGQQKTFHVNQDEDDIIDIGEAANNSTITFTQGGLDNQSITLNQSNDETINLQGIIAMTQQEYDDEGEGKLTDNNWYFIYE